MVDTFLHDIQAERVARLNAQSSDLEPKMRLHRLLYDYFEPSLTVAQTRLGRNYVVILARLSTEQTQVTRDIFSETVQPVRELYLRNLRQLFPGAPDADVGEALLMGVTLMATIVTKRETVEHCLPPERARHDARRLADFVAAGFEAWFGTAVSPPTIAKA